MDPRRAPGQALALLLLLFSFGIASFATPMKPDMGQILRRAAEPETHYPVARVGWNGSEVEAKPFNPVYESMMYAVSPEALRDRFLRIALPSPAVLLSVFGVILLLRMMRRERERSNPRFDNVVVMPTRTGAAREAA